jgi:hypothetical protein
MRPSQEPLRLAFAATYVFCCHLLRLGFKKPVNSDLIFFRTAVCRSVHQQDI